MKTFTRACLLSVGLLCVCGALCARAGAAGVFRQTSTPSPPAPLPGGKSAGTKDALLDPRRARALEVIESEINRARRYTLARDRIRVWAAAADELWEFNPVLARKTLRDAFAELAEAAPPRRADEDEGRFNLRRTEVRNQLRTEIYYVAQRHEPVLFREFLRQTTDENEKNRAQLIEQHNVPIVFGSSSLEKRSLAEMAARLAPTDPSAAVDFAVQSLGYGVPQELQEVFRALIASSPQSAHELFARAAEIYIADPSPNLYDAQILGVYFRLHPHPTVAPALMRRFLEAVYNRALRVRAMTIEAQKAGQIEEGQQTALLILLNDFLPLARAHAPDIADRMWTLSRQVAPDASASQREHEEVFPDSGTTTGGGSDDVDGLLARAGAAKSEENRDALLFQAALVLIKSSNYERALEVAGRARPSETRASVLNYLRAGQARQLIAAGELNDALKVIEKIEDIESRAGVTIALAAAARKRGDALLARSELARLERLLEAEKNSPPHARAFLWLASTYADIDPAEGLEMMSAAIRSANSAVELDEMRSDERIVHLGGASRQAIGVGGIRADFLGGFRALARHDFMRTLQLAESFENPLLRGQALVSAAAAVLKERPERPAQPSTPQP